MEENISVRKDALAVVVHREVRRLGSCGDLSDDEAAWEEATSACGETIKELDGDLKAGPEWRMEVTKESGAVLYRLRFSAEAYDK
jgi:uncharacterized protein DUF6894